MRTRGRKPASRASGQSGPSYVRAFDYLIVIASVGAIASLAYLLFCIMSGHLASQIIGGLQLEAVTRRVGLARTIFLWSLWVAILTAMVRHYRNESVGVIACLVGAACWLVMPLLVSSRVPTGSALPLFALGQSLVTSFHTSGGAMVVVGVIRIVLGRIALLAREPQTAAAMRVPGRAREMMAAAEAASTDRPSLMRRCWEMHFCRKSLRSMCPRYLEKTSCWRKRSGCYCDQGLATRLLETVSANARVEMAEELRAGQVGAVQRASAPGEGLPRRATKKRKKAPCGECPIYVEHQKYKYRALSWLSYPVAAAVVGFAYHHIRAAYEWVDWHLSDILAEMELLPDSLTDAPLEAASWLNAENAVVVMVGIITVGVLLQLTEVVVFRLKW